MTRVLKYILQGVLIGVVCVLAGGAVGWYAMGDERYGTAEPLCDEALWDHVYHKERLQIIKPCVEMTGVIDSVRLEEDGDYHIRVVPDKQYRKLLNKVNREKQRGALVVEPICTRESKEAAPRAACGSFRQNFGRLPEDARVRVRGAYVLDTEHGWLEAHPVTSIEIIK